MSLVGRVILDVQTAYPGAMTNPQLTENLLAVIRSLPADDRRWLLRQLEQDSSDLSHGALAEIAMAGG
jgi:hypothetical protein